MSQRDRLTWGLYLLIGALAVLQAGVGGLLPYLQAELGLTHTLGAAHVTALSAGGLLAGLLAERLRRRLGRAPMLLGVVAVSLVGALALATAASPWQSVPALLLVGAAVGGALVVGQSLLVARGGEAAPRLIGEFNLAYALGAVTSMVALPLLARASWRGLPLLEGGLLLLLVAPLLLRARELAARAPEGGGRTGSGGWTLARPRTALAAMCLCVAVEWSFLFWLTTYLVSVSGHERGTAALVTSAMWLMVLVGRATGTVLLPRHGGARVLAGSLLLALLAVLALRQAEAVWLAVLAAGLAGAAAANLYPASVALVVSGPGQADALVARATLLSSATTVVFPLLIGRLADLVGLESAFWLVPATAVCALLVVRLSGPRRILDPRPALEGGTL